MICSPWTCSACILAKGRRQDLPSQWGPRCSQLPTGCFLVWHWSIKLGKRVKLESTRNISVFPMLVENLPKSTGTERETRREGSEGQRPWAVFSFPWPRTPRSFSLSKLKSGCSFCFSPSEWIWLGNPTPAVPTSSLGCNYLNFRHKHFLILEILHLFILKMTSWKL